MNSTLSEMARARSETGPRFCRTPILISSIARRRRSMSAVATSASTTIGDRHDDRRHVGRDRQAVAGEHLEKRRADGRLHGSSLTAPGFIHPDRAVAAPAAASAARSPERLSTLDARRGPDSSASATPMTTTVKSRASALHAADLEVAVHEEGRYGHGDRDPPLRDQPQPDVRRHLEVEAGQPSQQGGAARASPGAGAARSRAPAGRRARSGSRAAPPRAAGRSRRRASPSGSSPPAPGR